MSAAAGRFHLTFRVDWATPEFNPTFNWPAFTSFYINIWWAFLLPGCPDVPHRYANIPPSHHLTDGWHRGVVCVVFVCRENTVSAGCVPFSVIYLINFSIQHVPTILQSSFKTHHNTYTIYKYIYILYKRQSIPFFSVLLSYEARFLSLTERVLHLHNRSTHLYQHFNFPGCGLLWLRPQHFSDWLQVIRIITNQQWRGKSTCDRAVICVWYLRAYELRQ